MPDIDKLNSAIDSYSAQSFGSNADGGELQNERALSLEAYTGKNIEPAPEGRSQVTDWSVFETIQWILPSLTRIFAGGDDIVEFEPEGPEDEDAAKQESEVLNAKVTGPGTNWFLTCLTWFQDALVTKNAYVLVQMEEKIVPETEKYEKQTIEQVQMILEDDVEVVGQEMHEDFENPVPVDMDPFTGEPIMGPTVTFDIEIKKTKPVRKLKFKPLPSERCKVGEDTPDFTLEDCKYFEYWDLETISDMRKQGFEIDDDISDEPYTETEEDAVRDERLASGVDIENTDPASRQILVRNIWIEHDYDEDGIAELLHVIRVGREILFMEETSNIPVASIVPFINTHRHIGMSISDLVFDVQRIKTALLRGGLDSLNLSINPRHAVSTEVNLDDLLVSRPGGVVRLRPGAIPGQGHVVPLPTEFVFPQAQEGMRHMDTVIESRVGVNRIFQGIDEATLNDHNRIGQLSTMAAQRVEQIARVFANGVERLFALAHELIIKSGHQEETIKLRGEWTNINPTQWRTGRDMRVVAPFAAGNKDSLLQRLMIIAQIHEKALAGGLPIVDAQDAYSLALEIASAADVPGDRFFTDPSTIPPQPPPPDYTGIALEIENKKADNQAADSERDAQVKATEIEVEAEIKKFQIETNAQLQIALAQIKGDQAVDLEKVRAFLKDSPDFMAKVIERTGDMQSELKEAADTLRDTLAAVEAAANSPRELVKDDNGNVTGVRVNGQVRGINRDESGNITGLS